MKILLVSVNASYMHTNVAIRSLKAYADSHINDSSLQIDYAEYTINQPIGEVLRSIGFTGADMVLFSTYIWNAEYVCKILPDIKKILPECVVGAGGPEFGYGARKYLKMLPALDFVMFGEGELSFTELAKTGISSLSQIKGVYYRDSQNTVVYSGDQPLIENLDELPFAYPEILRGDFDPDHKIYYYESTRGCPFSCAYCLSSVDKRVRFKTLERVQQELQIFLDANVKLVKFIDRTYNLNPDRYIPIWQYILSHHNGKTMFHFEIEAEYLSDEALDFLQKVPSGVMQFEMGVQSSNKETLKAVNRSDNTEVLSQKIRRIPRTIHQHLDLIAGLPYENLEIFGHSYDYVMDLRPDALQLGFLKVLNGTEMAEFASKNGWKWMENPVYETFSTPYLSFADVAFLKDIEVATDAYWNKEIFSFTMAYIFRKLRPWVFMCEIVNFGRKQDAFLQARRELYWFELLSKYIEYIEENCESVQETGEVLDFKLMKDLLRYDFVRSGKKGNFPEWYVHRYDKDKHRSLLDKHDMLGNSRIGFALSEYEEFEYDVTSKKPEENPGHFELLIKYGEK
ncbi:MAG: DUF4080 domain-containing protein [Treponema sp.]|nr:DUF4080 domain-containing protein [Candidatus Treponema equifaecale]